MITDTKTLLHNLLETFSNKGLEGDNLNQTILAAGAYASLLNGNQQGAEHFLNRLNQTQSEEIDEFEQGVAVWQPVYQQLKKEEK